MVYVTKDEGFDVQLTDSSVIFEVAMDCYCKQINTLEKIVYNRTSVGVYWQFYGVTFLYPMI